MAQQYDYSDSLPLFNVEFGKLPFKGKHIETANNIDLREGGGF